MWSTVNGSCYSFISVMTLLLLAHLYMPDLSTTNSGSCETFLYTFFDMYFFSVCSHVFFNKPISHKISVKYIAVCGSYGSKCCQNHIVAMLCTVLDSQTCRIPK